MAKHCAPHTRVRLRLLDGYDGLSLTVADEGPGFDLGQFGTSPGITGMRDRLEAIGGQFAIESTMDLGTTVIGYVPPVVLG